MDSEAAPLLCQQPRNAVSPTFGEALEKERVSDLLYQYDRVISSIEQWCIEINCSNEKRMASCDVERLQLTIHLRDCLSDLKSSLQHAEQLVSSLHYRFQNDEEDWSVSTAGGDNSAKKNGTQRRDRYRREFWDQLVRHQSAVKIASRMGEMSSFHLESYLEYGPKRHRKKTAKNIQESISAPTIDYDYTSFPRKNNSNNNEDTLDGKLLDDAETGVGNWSFEELDNIFYAENPIDYTNKEGMKQRLLGNEEFAKIEEEHYRRNKATYLCAISSVITMILLIVAIASYNNASK
mmetsp:Transcript_9014/g.11633  ORF Transcript_9014/g.11633 Transcript_9014/m.11633 type:complete len:293 (+) Transcript_9014:66-944(+)